MTDTINPKDHTKEELLEIAAERDVEVSSSATKAEIAEALNGGDTTTSGRPDADPDAAGEDLDEALDADYGSVDGELVRQDPADAVGVDEDANIIDTVVIQTQKPAAEGAGGRLVQRGPLPVPSQPDKGGLSEVERVAVGLAPKNPTKRRQPEVGLDSKEG